MAKATIGPIGQIISWITFLLLLYSLLCAYIAGGSDLFRHILMTYWIEIPIWLASLIFTLIFGTVVYLGIRTVDYVNRGLMFVKLGAYFLLVTLLTPFIDTAKWMDGAINHIGSATALMVTITSFGYAAIVPSLRIYFAGDIKKLKQAILIGSFIPLIFYIIWDAAIMGVIPLNGEHGLVSIFHSPSSTSDLVNTLSTTTNKTTVTFFAKLFTSICVLTSFLGVALCLTDFLADGLQLEKKGKSNALIHVLTFLPPLVVVLFFPNAFIAALEYAGIYCVILLILIPAWMAWYGRYRRHLKGDYQAPGGKFLLACLIIVSLALIVRWIMAQIT